MLGFFWSTIINDSEGDNFLTPALLLFGWFWILSGISLVLDLETIVIVGFIITPIIIRITLVKFTKILN